MSRKGALLMLAVVVLWTALPAFACLTPASSHACCRGMMQECGPSSAMASQSCCAMQKSDASPLPGTASRAPGDSGASQIAFVTVPVTIASAAPVTGLAASPPLPPPALHSILRV